MADASVDVIISNCIINLSPEKKDVFREAWRVLRPGGRLAILDMVALRTLPDEIKTDLSLISGCAGGTEKIEDIEKMIQEAGFIDINIQTLAKSRESIGEWFPGRSLYFLTIRWKGLNRYGTIFKRSAVNLLRIAD